MRRPAAARRAKKLQQRLDFDPTISDRFRQFHHANPQVYLAIVAACRAMRADGVRHASMKLVYEKLRAAFETKTRRGAEPFKLNNDFTAPYARLVMEREADLAGFFNTRTRKSA